MGYWFSKASQEYIVPRMKHALHHVTLCVSALVALLLMSIRSLNVKIHPYFFKRYLWLLVLVPTTLNRLTSQRQLRKIILYKNLSYFFPLARLVQLPQDLQGICEWKGQGQSNWGADLGSGSGCKWWLVGCVDLDNPCLMYKRKASWDFFQPWVYIIMLSSFGWEGVSTRIIFTDLFILLCKCLNSSYIPFLLSAPDLGMSMLVVTVEVG